MPDALVSTPPALRLTLRRPVRGLTRHPLMASTQQQTDGQSTNSLSEHGAPVLRILPDRVRVPEWLLDTKPRITSEVSRHYVVDPFADAQYLQVKLLLDEEGVVEDVQVLDTNMPLDEARFAADRYLAMRFSPGKIRGVAVRTEKYLEIDVGPAALSQLAPQQ